jgi:hypothetical protein
MNTALAGAILLGMAACSADADAPDAGAPTADWDAAVAVEEPSPECWSYSEWTRQLNVYGSAATASASGSYGGSNYREEQVRYKSFTAEMDALSITGPQSYSGYRLRYKCANSSEEHTTEWETDLLSDNQPCGPPADNNMLLWVRLQVRAATSC